MAKSVLFTALGQPKPKQRPKVFRGRGVTPVETVEAEKQIRDAFLREFPLWEPLSGPVDVKIAFYMTDRRRVDWDNLAKLVCDALNGVAFKDDAQIVRCVVDKILPTRKVPGANGRPRNRRAGDPLTSERTGEPYEPHTEVFIHEREDLT